MLDTMSSKSVVMSLPIDSIGELPDAEYVGLIDDNAVQCLTVRLAAERLLSPIWVRRNGNAAKNRWTVIAGRHRLRAAMALGWAVIEAEQRADERSTGNDLRQLQVAENLDRRVLRPIELACHYMERWREAAAAIEPSTPENQQSAAIRGRWSVLASGANTLAGDTGAVDRATANACAVSEKTIRDYRKLHTEIVIGLPNHFARLNAHPLAAGKSAMLELASVAEMSRVKAAEAILSRADWKNIREPLVSVGIRESNGNRLDACQPDVRFWADFQAMSAPRQRVNIRALARSIAPEIALEFVDELKEKGILRGDIRIA